MTKVDALPARPSLEYLKKLAKQQVASLRKQGQTASLADAQLAIARKYGFPSWRRLKSHIELLQRQVAPFDATAENEASSTTFDGVMKAITTRDNQTLAQLLAAAPSVVNQTGPHPRWGGRPQPLHVAIESDNAHAFELLLNAGANVDGKNQHYDGWSPLMLAAHWKRAEMREELIRRGATIDLIAALMLRDDRGVVKLLKDPSVLRGTFPNSASALHFARTAMSARLLLSLGLKVDALDKYGKTAPQCWADAERPSPGLMRLADSLGVKPPSDIFKAVEQGRLTQVRELLSGGVDVNSRFPTGSQGALLHNAAFNGDLSMVKLLIDKGADLRALDREHEATPAHWARYALTAFNREACKAVAEYLEGLMNA
jgi:Ankyrin repeats (3 copies)/Ankyrin repeats (many copies)